MPESKHSVGDSIEARCTKCRKNLTHSILSLDGESPALVECSKCHRQHAYRKPTAAKKSPARQAASGKTAEQKEWKLLQPKMDSMKAGEYSMSAGYKVNAVIRHPAFGLGIVQRVIGKQKVEVLFEDGKKMMRCGQP